MNLFESERKVMDVLWREGSITAEQEVFNMQNPKGLGELIKELRVEKYWLEQKHYIYGDK